MNLTQIHQIDVNRWAANKSPKLRNSGDTNDQHSLRMIKLLIALFGNQFGKRIRTTMHAIALHDVGESQLGDVSGKAKQEHPQLAAALDQAEAENRAAMGLRMPKLNETEWHSLRALADVIAPPSPKYGVPGAGDEDICKNVIKDAGHAVFLARWYDHIGQRAERPPFGFVQLVAVCRCFSGHAFGPQSNKVALARRCFIWSAT